MFPALSALNQSGRPPPNSAFKALGTLANKAASPSTPPPHRSATDMREKPARNKG